MFRLKEHPYFRELIYVVGLTLISILLFAIHLNAPSQLDAIKKNGILRVAMRNTPVTYYIDKEQPAGFEYELSKAFADYLGVRLEIITPASYNEMFKLLRERSVHIAASNLAITPERAEQFNVGPSYRSAAQTLIYRIKQGNPQPKELSDIFNKNIIVMARSAQAHLLSDLQEMHPELTFESLKNTAATDLLDRVHNGQADYTVLDSGIFESQQSFYPGLARGFDLSEPQPVAWLLSNHYDGTLLEAVNQFFALESTQKLIKTLSARYFERQNQLNFFDTSAFRDSLKTNFPPLEQYFSLASQESGIDKVLLASIAYQESHWNPDAVSPTGVKGIMMLTEGAAQEVGVSDRTDPRQSILGGARYLVTVKAKIPDRIPEPDHTWFALAGYNVGFGHLEDARVLAQQAGKNPDNWSDVRKFLPLLSNEKYYSKTRYGFARGYEPVSYVSNIRKYMEILRWEEQVIQVRRNRRPPSEPQSEATPAAKPLNNLPTSL